MQILWQSDRRLSEFSTFGIGGKIAYFAEIRSVDAMREAFLFASQAHLPILILGKGSNCLFSDEGFAGIVLSNRIDFCHWDLAEKKVMVGAGYSFSLLGTQSVKRGLGGLEFASGIPASVGGAVFMNAGANGFETCEKLYRVGFLGFNGEERCFLKQDLLFGYRLSPFQTMQGAILFAEFALEEGANSKAMQKAMIEKRRLSQPLQEKSAGCVFRNPSGKSAGALIDACGLKGERIGDAVVSEKHANFIVNRGSARAKDVLELIEKVKKRVKEEQGIELEVELRIMEINGHISR